MATEKEVKKESSATEHKQVVKEVKKQPVEIKYTVSELIEAAEGLETSPVVVKTALEASGKSEFTISEAKKIINTFKNKEVKA